MFFTKENISSGIPNVLASEVALTKAIKILKDKVPGHAATSYDSLTHDAVSLMQDLIHKSLTDSLTQDLFVVRDNDGNEIASVLVNNLGEFTTPSVFFDIGHRVRAKVTKRDDFWKIAFMEPDPNSQGDLVLTYRMELNNVDTDSRLYKFGHINNDGVQIDTTEELLFGDECSVQATTKTDEMVVIVLKRRTGEKFVRLRVNEAAGPAVYWYEKNPGVSKDSEGIDQLMSEACEIVNNPAGFNNTGRYVLVSESWVVNDENNRISYYKHYSDTEPNYRIELSEINGETEIVKIGEQLDDRRDAYTILTQRLVGDDQIEVSVSTDSGVLPLRIHLDPDTGLILSVDIARQEGGGFDDDDYDDDDYGPFTGY